MEYLAKILVFIVAIEHVYILILEMFLWTKPRGLKAFGLTKEVAESSKVLAANQGLYNGFLALGLFLGLLHPNEAFGLQIQVFLLSCILVAAIYGYFTAKKSILITQGLPAFFAIFLVFLMD